MTEYWKSVGNYYCEFCKFFVRNDEFSRRQHEASDRHQNSMKRQVRDIHRKTEQERRQKAQVDRELARIGGKAIRHSTCFMSECLGTLLSHRLWCKRQSRLHKQLFQVRPLGNSGRENAPSEIPEFGTFR